MISEAFIQNILIGVRKWVNGKLEDLGYVISSHINEIETKLGSVETGAQANVIETIKLNGNALVPTEKAVDITVPDATVTGIKSGDKILSLEETMLTSTLSLNYDSTNTKLQIKGIGDEVISEIDATAFIKDGMLDSASIHTRKMTSGVASWNPALPEGVTEPSGWNKSNSGTYIVLVWNTDSGKSAAFVNVNSLAGTYTAGTGLTLTDHEFGLNIAQSSVIGGVMVADAASTGLTLGDDGSLSITTPSLVDIMAILENGSPDPGPGPDPDPGPVTPVVPNNEIWYTTSDGNTETSYNTGSLPSIESNTYVDGKGIIKFTSDITNLGYGAFNGCSRLTSIAIPNSITNIESHAFKGCSGLTSATISNSITALKYHTFYGCSSLTSVTIPNGVTNIEEGVFNGCSSLTSMIIPDSTTSVGYGSFQNCTGLTSLTIGNSVTKFVDNAFSGCSSLTSISYTGTMNQWNAITKGHNWNNNVPASAVHCTDGDVSLQ